MRKPNVKKISEKKIVPATLPWTAEDEAAVKTAEDTLALLKIAEDMLTEIDKKIQDAACKWYEHKRNSDA